MALPLQLGTGSSGAPRGPCGTRFEQALAYALAREQFGRPIAGFQITQAKLADAVAAYDKAMLLALHLARFKDTGRLTPNLVGDGKLDNVRAALDVARSMRTILGGSGITADYSTMRHAANLETVLTYESTQEVHQLVVGKALTRWTRSGDGSGRAAHPQVTSLSPRLDS